MFIKKMSLISLIFILFFSFNINCYAEMVPQNKKVLYLTFDDGPSIIIDEILTALKQCDVKATFFVVGKEIIGREATLKKIYDEGHSIGLHTYSHNFKKIYKDNSTFVNEMLDTKALVERVTGASTNIIRFPGGTAGHLTEEMLNLLHENNFKIYDWNVSLEDGVNPSLSEEQLFKNASKCKSCEKSIILLMHCNSNNLNTAKAIPSIIKFYREKGYEILPITNSTPEYFYRIKKHGT